MKMNTVLQVWLTWIFTKAIGICGAGLAAVGMTTSDNTPALMAGVVLTALQVAASWWNTRRALNAMPASPKMVTSLPIRVVAFGVLVVGGGLGLTGCGTTAKTSAPTATVARSATATTSPVEAALPLIRTGAAVATGAVLDFGVKQTGTRTRLANEMYSAANAVYSLSGGTFPAPAQLEASVLSFGGSETDAGYAEFSTAIAGLYGAYYPKLVAGDAKTASDLLNALAGGIEDATRSYVTVPTATN